MRFAVATFALLLAGCASVPYGAREGAVGYWMKADATDQDFARDNYACLRDTTFPASGSGPLAFGTERDNRLYRTCMASKGYRQPE